MSSRRSPSLRLARQAAELAVAAPQVIALRTARMAAAGASPSAQDQAEFLKMGAEKVAAFYESWAATWSTALQVQIRLGGAWMSSASAASGAMTKVALAGLAPVHGRAVANAKRLSRHKR
jgi:hypothetical protein